MGIDEMGRHLTIIDRPVSYFYLAVFGGLNEFLDFNC